MMISMVKHCCQIRSPGTDLFWCVFWVAKPCLNFIKFYRMKLDILSFNLIGNISYLDQYIESYNFSKFDPDSGMNSVADWL